MHHHDDYCSRHEESLAEGWISVGDQTSSSSSSRRRYYVNAEKGVSSWERPPPPNEFDVAAATAGCAYVWLLMNGHEYLPGVLVSMWSVRRTQTCAKLVVMVTPDVVEWARELLELVADSVVLVNPIKARCIPLNTPRKEQLYSMWYDMSFTKWRALGLTSYRKVLFLDADVIVTRCVDELFLLPAPAATFSSPWHAPWNAQARRPNPFCDLCHADLVPPELVHDALHGRGSVCIGTTVLLSPPPPFSSGGTAATFRGPKSSAGGGGGGGGGDDVFENWLHAECTSHPFGYPGCSSMYDEQAICGFYASRGQAWTYIDQAYNAIPWKLDTGWLRGRTPAVLHYFGSIKPWSKSQSKSKEQQQPEYSDFENWDVIARELVAEVPHVGCAVIVSDDILNRTYRTPPLLLKPDHGENKGGGVVDAKSDDDDRQGVGGVMFQEEGVEELLRQQQQTTRVQKEEEEEQGRGREQDVGVGVGVVAVADRYDRTARFKREEVRRDESDFIDLRKANNFAKIGLNVAAVNLWKLRSRRHRCLEVPEFGLRIFDVACGTGGDVGKFLKSASDSGCRIQSYLAADISPESVHTCAERLRGKVPEAEAVVVDLSRRDIFHVLPSWAAISSFHIASCQFALHYFFESEGSLRLLARSLGRLLTEGGIFVCICADGEEVSRAILLQHHRQRRGRGRGQTFSTAREATGGDASSVQGGEEKAEKEDKDEEAGVVRYGRAEIRPSVHTVERILRLDHESLLPAGEEGQRGTLEHHHRADPFGLDYEFSMGSHVLGVREFVVDRWALDRVFLQEAHMHRILDVCLADLISRMRAKGSSSFWENLAQKMQLLDDVVETHLYRAYVYVKDTSDGEVEPNEVDRTRRAFVSFLFA